MQPVYLCLPSYQVVQEAIEIVEEGSRGLLGLGKKDRRERKAYKRIFKGEILRSTYSDKPGHAQALAQSPIHSLQHPHTNHVRPNNLPPQLDARPNILHPNPRQRYSGHCRRSSRWICRIRKGFGGRFVPVSLISRFLELVGARGESVEG